jgi:peptidoglycan/LPS O-acetylase OafA/YrhL
VLQGDPACAKFSGSIGESFPDSRGLGAGVDVRGHTSARPAPTSATASRDQQPFDEPASEPSDNVSLTSPHHRADIQGLRGVAVLLVVLFHAGVAVPGGYIGVDVFFVISGFVITNLLLRELVKTNELGFRRFYARRVRRLFPALALLVVVVSAVALLLLSPLGTQQQTAMLGRAALTFRANFSLYNQKAGYFDLSPSTNPFLHTWSLAVEEQFYLVYPAFLFVAWRVAANRFATRSRDVVVFAIVAAGTLLSLWLSLDLTAGHDLQHAVVRPLQFAFYSSPTRAWEFGFGCLVALAAPVLVRLPRLVAALCGAAGLIIIVVSARTIRSWTPFPGTAALWPVTGAALVILAGIATVRGASRLLSTKPLVWVGDLSYSWYLWHWPFIVFGAALWPDHSHWFLLFMALVALIPSWLSYTFVEQPIRTRRGVGQNRVLVIGAVCLVIPLLATSGLTLTSDAMSHSSAVRSFRSQFAPHATNNAACDRRVQAEPNPRCTAQPATRSRGEVWLVGDSQAGQFVEAVDRAGTQDGYAVTASHYDQCPFVDLLLIIRGVGPSTDCRRFVRRTVENLAQRRPKLVIIASNSNGYIQQSMYELSDPTTGTVASTAQSKAQLWQHGLLGVLQTLRRANVPTLIVNSIPHFGTWDPRTCPAFRILHNIAACGVSRAASSVRRGQDATNQVEREAARAAGSDTIDFTDELCSKLTCATNRGTTFLYLDGSHLTTRGALMLTTDFAQRISSDASRAG